jgi:hypothetical protein
MDIFYEAHRLFLKRLLEDQIDFILVGEYAINYHGIRRASGVMELWLKPTNENKEKFIKMIRSEGFNEEGINYIADLDFTKPCVFHTGQIPLRIDFLTFITIVKFDEAFGQKVLLPLGDKFVPVLHINDLILSKMTSDRKKDILDVEELQKIIRSNKRID